MFILIELEESKTGGGELMIWGGACRPGWTQSWLDLDKKHLYFWSQTISASELQIYIYTLRTEESQLNCFFYNFEIGTHKSSPVRSTASPPSGKPSSDIPLGQEKISMTAVCRFCPQILNQQKVDQPRAGDETKRCGQTGHPLVGFSFHSKVSDVGSESQLRISLKVSKGTCMSATMGVVRAHRAAWERIWEVFPFYMKGGVFCLWMLKKVH